MELLKHGEWHGSLEQRVIISNARLVQLIQRLDRSTAEDFINSSESRTLVFARAYTCVCVCVCVCVFYVCVVLCGLSQSFLF